MRERGAPARGGGVAGESVIAFLFLLSAPLAEAREFPDARSCPRLPGANAEETRKQCNELTREQLLALPTAEFCEVATKKRTLSHDLQTTDSIEEYEAKFYTPKEYMWEAPWKLAMYPHSRTRSAALDGAVAIAQWEGSQEDLVKFLSKPGTILSTFPDKNRLGVYQKRNLQRTNVQQIEQAQAQKAVVCRQYGMANTINCVHSLDTMLAMMSPRDNGDTLVELMIEVFTDPRYVEPARLAAKKVLARVRRDLPEREGDLFGDILAAFVESGVPTPEAEEMAWKFLAMTQVHGVDSPMFLRDLTTKANSPILIATAVIGAGEYILDGRRVKSGHLYSYPPNVRSHCDFGKAYHFWIAAYLSRAL
ncbi:MAG: hypothetical protein ACXWP5_06755, partial [Bdellovibrionota bacterium]